MVSWAKVASAAAVALLVAGWAPAAGGKGGEAEDDERNEREERGDREAGEPERAGAEAFDAVERKVVTRVDAARAEFKLEREEGPAEDELKFSFDTGDVQAKVEFESENLTGESEVELRARFRELVEFEDANGNGAFDPWERVVQRISLASAAWRPLVLEDASAAGAAGKVVRARADLTPGGLFGLDFFVFGEFARVGSVSLEPTEVKFDILIQGFPYQSNSSQVALRLETRHEAEFEAEAGEDAEDDDEVAGDEDAVVVQAGPVKALLTWKENATVDGASRPVRATFEKVETEQEMEDGEAKTEEKRVFALSYARGSDILHDPVLGIASASAVGLGPAVLVAAGLVAVAAVAAAFVVFRRR